MLIDYFEESRKENMFSSHFLLEDHTFCWNIGMNDYCKTKKRITFVMICNSNFIIVFYIHFVLFDYCIQKVHDEL